MVEEGNLKKHRFRCLHLLLFHGNKLVLNANVDSRVPHSKKDIPDIHKIVTENTNGDQIIYKF